MWGAEPKMVQSGALDPTSHRDTSPNGKLHLAGQTKHGGGTLQC